jgi:nascent polypeptide-associated complex subunit beta
VQASIPSNTFVINGRVETKHLMELMPGIVNQLSQEHINKIMSQYSNATRAASAATGSVPTVPEGDEEDDDQIPDLVDGNFEDASKK